MKYVYLVQYSTIYDSDESVVGVFGDYNDAVLHAETQVSYMVEETEAEFGEGSAFRRTVSFCGGDRADVDLCDRDGKVQETFRVIRMEVQ